jgi:hypothetical protein
MIKWNLEDYRDYYNERAGIQSESIGSTINQAEMQAYNATLELFKEQEKPTQSQIREFHIYLRKNKNKG